MCGMCMAIILYLQSVVVMFYAEGNENNCYYNRALCGENSYCSLENGEYRCICRSGYLCKSSVHLFTPMFLVV